jgi:peroxiredoxin
MRKAFLIICLLFSSNLFSAKLNPGDKAPGFILSDINNSKITFKQILTENKPVIISFFATWCKPCLKEIIHLQELQKLLNVNVYLINIDSLTREKVSKFVADNNFTLPVLLDPNAELTGENYGIRDGGQISIPRLFLISPSGTVKYVARGYDNKTEQCLIDKILEGEKQKIPGQLAIFFTNSANGYMESCDCPDNPYGGIVRCATYLKQQRQKYTENLLFDSGDIFPPRCSPALTECLLKSYELLNYDAVGIGDQEISIENFLNIYRNYKIPFISSNLNYCEGDVCNFMTPHEKFIEKAGKKIAILSIVSPDVFDLYPPEFTTKYVILPVKDTISGFISQNKGKYDLLILISHSGFDIDKQIAADFPDIDVIIGGHSQTKLLEPCKIGKTLIVQAGQDARNIGKLILKLDDARQISNYDYEIIPLTKDIPDDPQIRSLINAYKAGR